MFNLGMQPQLRRAPKQIWTSNRRRNRRPSLSKPQQRRQPPKLLLNPNLKASFHQTRKPLYFSPTLFSSLFNFNLNTNRNKEDKTEKPEGFRALKGVMRVGLLAKGLLLKGDTDVRLIVICSNKPTKSLLERVYKLLMEKIEVC